MIESQRHLFALPDHVSYLNCAYMAPLMHTVVEAGAQGVRRKACPWTIATEDFFTESDTARHLFARIVNANSDDIAIVPSASYGIAVAAHNIRIGRGEEILLLADQFPSNVYAWRELAGRTGASVVTVPRPDDQDWTRATLEQMSQHTRLVALPHCHWTDGGLLDLEAIGRHCRESGSALVLDLTQSAGALPFDVRTVQPDFAVVATYKWLLGPYSLGFLYIAPEHRGGNPIEHSWMGRAGSDDFAGLVDYTDDLAPDASRFDMGERANFHLMPMAIAAMEQILDWGVAAIAETLAIKTAAIAERASALDLSSVTPRLRAGHFLGLRFSHGLPAGLPELLAAEQIFASVRGDSLRVTPHLYNTEADVERFSQVLEQTIKSG